MIKCKQNILSLFFITSLLFFSLENVFAQSGADATDDKLEPNKISFITMPDDVNQSLLKSIYERTLFNINTDKDGYYLQTDEVRGKENLRRTWLGSPIKNKNSYSDKLTLYFKPKYLRKVSDVVLDSFKMEFELKNSSLIVRHSFAREKEFLIMENDIKSWIMTNNKTDVIMYLPSQKLTNNKTLGFMVCPRANSARGYSQEISLIDTGYVIDKVKMDFKGETSASFTTGSNYKGRLELKVLTTDTLSTPEIPHDISFGKDPQVEVSYVPSDEKVFKVLNDNEIVGGLKFLYDMQYESGKQRITDFTNYNWIKKNNIDLPQKLQKLMGEKKVTASIMQGACYSIVLNSKIFKNYYLTGKKHVDFIE